MPEINLKVDEDGEMELTSAEIEGLNALLADEAVMDWLLKLEVEDTAAETLDEECSRRLRRSD